MGALFSSEEDDLRRRSVTRSPSMDTSTSHDLAEPPVGTNRKADLADILLLLMNINESKIQIPLMLVVDILNYAGALPSVEATNATPFRSGGNCDLCYLAMPLPRSPYITPISMHIVVESKDQGWSSYPQEKGTRTSHTWGELGLSCAPTVRYPVFRNIHAGASFETQEFDYALSSAGTGAEVNETIVPLINAMRAGISKFLSQYLPHSHIFIQFRVLLK